METFRKIHLYSELKNYEDIIRNSSDSHGDRDYFAFPQ
jgi:hypothetical protein